MKYRVAINGYGRIGQSLLRSALGRDDLNFDIVAINELADVDTIAYLTQYDSTHGRFPESVNVLNSALIGIKDKQITVSSDKDIEDLNWGDLDVDIVFDCTGVSGNRAHIAKHIQSGAKRAIVSQPGDGSFDQTIVYGINHQKLSYSDKVISAASCTSNAVVPVLSALSDRLEISSGSLTTIHSAMNDQPVIDAYHHSNLRLTRSAMHNIVPVETGLAKGVERLLPELTGKLSATAIRVPTINVSAMEVGLYIAQPVSVEEINSILKDYADSDKYSIFKYTEQPLASCDFIQDIHSCIVDGSQTRVSGEHFVKILIWFDNEWAFANRMLDIASYWLSVSSD